MIVLEITAIYTPTPGAMAIVMRGRDRADADG